MKYYVIVLCLLLAIGANSFTAVEAQVNVKDSLALIDLYRSTKGHDWRHHNNWLTTQPLSTWYGITVTGTRVTGINLSYNYLTNKIPASIGSLTQLQSLNLQYNSISGGIPTTIGNLIHLEYLNFAETYLGGKIPASIGNLISLQYLKIFRSQVSDSIPAAIGNLVNLKELDLDGNNFTGNFPASIGNLINLQLLYAGQSNLTGSLPASIGNLRSLQILSLGYNGLSGSLPASIGNLFNLTYLGIFHNQLSGTIPSSIGNMSALTHLDLHTNHLTGELPATMSKLKKLSYVSLFENQLSENENIDLSMIHVHRSILIDISYNSYTFNGIESIGNKYPYKVYYISQAPIPIHQNGNTLSVSAGGTLSNNTYKWFKVDAAGSTTIKGDSAFTPSSSGRYYAKVTNAIATKLTLYTDTVFYTMLLQNNATFLAENTAQIKSANSKFSVYPNPAKDIVHIAVNGNAIVTLTNSAGKILLSKTINNSDAISVSSFANSTYYIQNKNTGETQKVIVAH